MNAQDSSRARGTIIKVPDSSPGLLFANGGQKPFTLEGVWKSAVAPAVNMTVDIEFDASGAIRSVAVVDQQQLAKEKMDQFSGVAQQHGKQAAELAKQGIGALAARMGKIQLGAAAAIWLAWFFLPAMSIDFFLKKSFTFWDLLGLDLSNSQWAAASTTHGFFALLGLAAIAVPFAVPFLKDPRAKFLNAAPLAFLALTLLKIRWDISSAVSQAQKAMGGNNAEMQKMFSEMAETAMKQMMDVISVGFGAYVLIAACAVLAFYAVKGKAAA
jgi:hypothetical protein